MKKPKEPKAPAYPLRERRKSRTRAALIKSAGELFATIGYDAATLDAIAERAEIHVQTLYRHFPNKESLAVAADWETLDRFKIALRERADGQPFIEFWRSWVVSQAERAVKRSPAGFLQRLADRDRNPAVGGLTLLVWNEYLDVLTDELSNDMDVNVKTDRHPRLFACMLWGGNQLGVRRWTQSGGKGDLVKEIGAVVDDVARVLDLWMHGRKD